MLGYRHVMVSTQGEAWSAEWRLRVRFAAAKGDGMKSVRECCHRGRTASRGSHVDPRQGHAPRHARGAL